MSFKLTTIPVVSLTTRDNTKELTWKLPRVGAYPAPPTRDYFYFAPTEECEGLLAKHQMVCAPTKSGFNLFYKQRTVKVKENGIEQVKPVNPGLLNGIFKRFTFAIYLNDKDIDKRYSVFADSKLPPNLYVNNLKSDSLIYSKDLTGLTIREEENDPIINLGGGTLSANSFISLQPAPDGGKDSYQRIIANVLDPQKITYNLSNRYSQSKPYGVMDIFLSDNNDSNALNYFISLI
jgi:hypothetical protein